MWLFILGLTAASVLAVLALFAAAVEVADEVVRLRAEEADLPVRWPRRKIQSIPSSIKEPLTLLSPDEIEEVALKRAREKLEQEERDKKEKERLEKEKLREQERINKIAASKILSKIAKKLLEEGTSQGCKIFEDDAIPSKEVQEILEFKLNKKGWESEFDGRKYGYYLYVTPLKELKDCSMSSYR